MLTITRVRRSAIGALRFGSTVTGPLSWSEEYELLTRLRLETYIYSHLVDDVHWLVVGAV